MVVQNKIVFIIGRDSWHKDNAVNHVLINFLKESNYKIEWQDPAGNVLHLLRNFENKFKKLPKSLKKINLRLVQLFYGILHWNYFVYLYILRNGSIDLRIQKLKKRIEKLGNQNEIIVLARSSGGRFCSKIADDLEIKQLICLSYPFKHPHEKPEKDRYLHLEKIATPMLIIQGDMDEYGGSEIKEQYNFSACVDLMFVNSDHNFLLCEDEWKRVLSTISEKIELN